MNKLKKLWTSICVEWWVFRKGVENIIAYAPIIWRDRDFDSNYLLELMEFKFRRMADSFDKYGHHENSEKDVAELKECAAICYRIREETHEEDFLAAHEAKWGKSVWHSSSTLMYFHRPNADTEEKREQESQELEEGYNEVERKIQVDLKRFGELFMNVRNWWD